MHASRLLERRALLVSLGAVSLAACSSRPLAPAGDLGLAGQPAPQAGHPAPPLRAVPLRLRASEREAAVARAMLLVNTPYRYGGNTPEGGFDCSGLVQYVLTPAGAPQLPRSTAQWAAVSVAVAAAALQRGDLVFFNTSGVPFSHMGLYVGGGQFVHAPSSGGTVRKDALGGRYFGARYQGARTVFES